MLLPRMLLSLFESNPLREGGLCAINSAHIFILEKELEKLLISLQHCHQFTCCFFFTGENTDLKESSGKGVISEHQLLLPVRAKHAPCRSPHLQTQPISSSTLEQNETGQETLGQAHMATLLPKELVGSEKRLVTPQKHHSGLKKLTQTVGVKSLLHFILIFSKKLY